MNPPSLMKTATIAILLVAVLSIFSLEAQAQERIGPLFPDIPGYQTLTCDLHIHTVFSDGSVWPTVRVQEAWRNGLDVLSITDHIEYLPKKDDVRPEFNRPYEIAKPEADSMHIQLVRGAEITRDEPHGHFNAVFLEDCAALDTPDQKDAVRIAHEQGAFVFWNHPEWKRKDGKAWSEIQQEYLDLGWMHGLEIFNGKSYYENAHRWALEQNLTLLGFTDIHTPIDERYQYHAGEHRTMTLAFVKEKTPAAFKEALFERRTVVFGNNTLAGREEWVKPLFESSVEVQIDALTLKGRDPFFVPIRNNSALSFELEADGRLQGLSFPGTLTLPAGKTVLMRLQGSGVPRDAAPMAIPYRVNNIWLAPGVPLNINFTLSIAFTE